MSILRLYRLDLFCLYFSRRPDLYMHRIALSVYLNSFIEF